MTGTMSLVLCERYRLLSATTSTETIMHNFDAKVNNCLSFLSMIRMIIKRMIGCSEMAIQTEERKYEEEEEKNQNWLNKFFCFA